MTLSAVIKFCFYSLIEIKTTPAVIPAAVSTNPFQDQGDWTKSLASPPPTVASGDLIFDPQVSVETVGKPVKEC